MLQVVGCCMLFSYATCLSISAKSDVVYAWLLCFGYRDKSLHLLLGKAVVRLGVSHLYIPLCYPFFCFWHIYLYLIFNYYFLINCFILSFILLPKFSVIIYLNNTYTGTLLFHFSNS